MANTQKYCSFDAKPIVSTAVVLEIISTTNTEMQCWKIYFKIKMNDDNTEFVLSLPSDFKTFKAPVTLRLRPPKSAVRPPNPANTCEWLKILSNPQKIWEVVRGRTEFVRKWASGHTIARRMLVGWWQWSCRYRRMMNLVVRIATITGTNNAGISYE